MWETIGLFDVFPFTVFPVTVLSFAVFLLTVFSLPTVFSCTVVWLTVVVFIVSLNRNQVSGAPFTSWPPNVNGIGSHRFTPEWDPL